MRETKSLNGLWYFLLDTGDSGDWWGEYFKRQTENPRFAFIYREWYDPDIPGITEEILAYRAKYPGKAILVSEFGAGAVRGYHAESGERWSEEYQARVIQQNIECMLKSGQLSGCFIWCLANFGGLIPNNIYERGYNVKGLVDEYRMPKQAYWAVREIFGKIR